jgi:uncharacterized Zn-binding protein involved in type VI secretion
MKKGNSFTIPLILAGLLIGPMSLAGQPAARVTDLATSPLVLPGPAPVPCVGGPILPPGVPTVLIGNLPAAIMTSQIQLQCGVPDTIVKGSATVLIGNLPAARLGDPTATGGAVIQGLPTVLIGG